MTTESPEPPERATPRVGLVLCVGHDRAWLGTILADLAATPVGLAMVVVVGTGSSPLGEGLHWVEVGPVASIGDMQVAGFRIAEDVDVIWFEHAPNPVDWGQLAVLTQSGVIGRPAATDWTARLKAAGVPGPLESPASG